MEGNSFISEHRFTLNPGKNLIEYEIECPQGADCFNSYCPGRDSEPAFQNNETFTIENKGNSRMEISSISANGRDWTSLESILKTIAGAVRDDPERKVFAIWDFCRKNILPGETIGDISFRPDDRPGLARFFNAFGTGACGTFNSVFALMAAAAGVKAQTGSQSDGSHAVARVSYGGGDRYFDALYGSDDPGKGIRGSFFRNNSGDVCSYGELCMDHYLVSRAGNLRIGELASLFGYHDSWRSDWWDGFEDFEDMTFSLYPGEKIMWDWQKPCKKVSKIGGSEENDGEHPFVVKKDNGKTLITYRCELPYPISGMCIEGIPKSCGYEAIVKLDSEKIPVEVYRPGNRVYGYELEMEIKDGAIPAEAAIVTQFNANPLCLPRLASGRNTIRMEYTAQKETVLSTSHRYKVFEIDKPEPPFGLIHDGQGKFSWQNREAGLSEFRFLLGDEKDSEIPWLPVFDSFTDEACIEFEQPGLLIDGKKYHWKVRSKNKEGVWSDWSATRSFVHKGCKSVNAVKAEINEGGAKLSWEPSPDAASYEIYGSNEKGFMPSKRQYNVFSKRNDDPSIALVFSANHITDTLQTEVLIDGSEGLECWYRIVPVASNGEKGSPSACACLPHPFILKESIRNYAAAGYPYKCFICVIKSLGAMHFNRLPDKPMYTGFHKRQVLSFEKIHGPEWLGIRIDDGYLSGTPEESDKGLNRFRVRVEDGEGKYHELDFDIEVV